MSWRLHHEFTRGARVLGAELATCAHCGTLRVAEEGKPTAFIRRVASEAERVRELEPPCISPAPFQAPW